MHIGGICLSEVVLSMRVWAISRDRFRHHFAYILSASLRWCFHCDINCNRYILQQNRLCSASAPRTTARLSAHTEPHRICISIWNISAI
ncbi:hypothetical protein BT96DRAFT_217243 [Gymnopus androsaceus JB14]|uniref:Uncharacterized protein n=1 Tax=Gymnopus androsaceus JB14 TaxID=1447944 RepID=A0A6A4H717_9AGAR|nr:hypothetical protein BT96DRAFT_217243 [Gymnopus androsaceus JB14]